MTSAEKAKIYYRKGFGPSDGDSAVMSDGEVIAMLETHNEDLTKRVAVLEGALSAAIKRIETIQETHPDICLDDDLKIYRRAYAQHG